MSLFLVNCERTVLFSVKCEENTETSINPLLKIYSWSLSVKDKIIKITQRAIW